MPEGTVAAFAPAHRGLGGCVSHVLVAAASGSDAVLVRLFGAVVPRCIAKHGGYCRGHPSRARHDGGVPPHQRSAVGTERLTVVVFRKIPGGQFET